MLTKSRRRKIIFWGRCFLYQGQKSHLSKISVNISGRYVMYVMVYHFADNLWNSATFARFRKFRNCRLRKSNPCHCGVNSIELTTMICNFAILISCSNMIPNSRPLFQLVMKENHWSISFDKIFFCLIWYFERRSGKGTWNYRPF